MANNATVDVRRSDVFDDLAYLLRNLLGVGNEGDQKPKPVEWTEATKQRLSGQFDAAMRVAGNDAAIAQKIHDAKQLAFEFADMLVERARQPTADYRKAFNELSELEFEFRYLDDPTPMVLRSSPFTLDVPNEQMLGNRPKRTPRNSTSTSPDEADLLLRGFEQQNQYIRLESTRTLAEMVCKANGKTCSQNTIRKTNIWMNWNPTPTGKKQVKAKRRTVRLAIDVARNSDDPSERLIAEEEAVSQITAMKLTEPNHDSILKKLVAGEMTPAQAIETAKMSKRR